MLHRLEARFELILLSYYPEYGPKEMRLTSEQGKVIALARQIAPFHGVLRHLKEPGALV